jgi:hypothetical protein
MCGHIGRHAPVRTTLVLQETLSRLDTNPNVASSCGSTQQHIHMVLALCTSFTVTLAIFIDGCWLVCRGCVIVVQELQRGSSLLF